MFDEFHRQIIIDEKLCKDCHISNDMWNRKGVTPFAVACFVYHAIHTLQKTPQEVYETLMTKWDKFNWNHTPIPINIWNRMFNDLPISSSEWDKILFPLRYIHSIYTTISSSTKHKCYPIFLGEHQQVSTDFLICTEESYRKTIIDKTSVKLTAYRYDLAQSPEIILESLRQETLKVIIPF